MAYASKLRYNFRAFLMAKGLLITLFKITDTCNGPSWLKHTHFVRHTEAVPIRQTREI